MLLMVKCHVGSKSSPGLMVNSPERKNAKKPRQQAARSSLFSYLILRLLIEDII